MPFCQWWFPAYLNHDLLAFAAGAKLRRPFGRIFDNGTAIEGKAEGLRDNVIASEWCLGSEVKVRQWRIPYSFFGSGSRRACLGPNHNRSIISNLHIRIIYKAL